MSLRCNLESDGGMSNEWKGGWRVGDGGCSNETEKDKGRRRRAGGERIGWYTKGEKAYWISCSSPPLLSPALFPPLLTPILPHLLHACTVHIRARPIYICGLTQSDDIRFHRFTIWGCPAIKPLCDWWTSHSKTTGVIHWCQDLHSLKRFDAFQAPGH